MRFPYLCAFLIVPALVWGQDIIDRPSAGASPTKVQASSSANIVSACLVLCGADHLDPANHFECKTSAPDLVTDHVVTVPFGLGNVCVRGVVINSAAVISEPSANQKTVLDVPFAPLVTE